MSGTRERWRGGNGSGAPLSRVCRASVRALCAAIFAAQVGAAPASAAGATVTLPSAATTSAGVYDSNGRLVRTLWRGMPAAAGTLTVGWDGKDDDGAPADPAGSYTARVLAHDVRYVWEGVIGNTSRDPFGSRVFRALGPINDIALDGGGNAFYVLGYNERQSGIHRFRTDDSRRQTSLAHYDYRRLFRFAATDGVLAYFANVGTPAEAESFVVALDVEQSTEHAFAAGEAVAYGQGEITRWQSVIDRSREPALAPSGLAVQKRGALLFVAHRDADEIRILDKRGGQQIGRIAVRAPRDLDVAPDDSLWALTERNGRPAVVRYELRDGEWTSTVAVAQGLEAPVAIGVSPVDGTLVVADAATEQLRAFDARGNSLWTYGRFGGYRDGRPDVSVDRLWLSYGATYVAFAPDGSFWVGDPGNVRNLHLSAAHRYLEQIMYLPTSSAVAVDRADPSRVFSQFLEFSVDYSKPIRESWTLVRNWGAGLDRSFFGGYEGLHVVLTLGNGRTYGVARRRADVRSDVVELTRAGLRVTGERLEPGEDLYPDGSVRYHDIGRSTLEIRVRRLAGFDTNGDLRWASSAALARVRDFTDASPYYHEVPLIYGINGPTYPDTESGVIVSFNPGRSNGFHLGGIVPGRDGWLWRASPTGSWTVDADGDITSRDGRYDNGRGVQYLGNVVRTLGRNIVYGYHGEGWNGGQANQWIHFRDDGLFVGQFGRPNYAHTNFVESRPESAGNAFSSELVLVGGNAYLWHNDESVHGGVVRWRIDNLDGMKTFETPIEP